MNITRSQLRAFGRDANGKPIAPAPSRLPRGKGAKAHAKRESLLEAKFARLWEQLGGPVLEREYKAVTNRRYRWDFAHITSRTLIEINGGTWARQGHSTGTGINRDAEKQRRAVECGWTPIAFTSDQITADEVERAIAMVKRRELVERNG